MLLTSDIKGIGKVYCKKGRVLWEIRLTKLKQKQRR